MKRERRHFDKEFKMMAINLVNRGKSTRVVAQELGIKADLIRRWRREHDQFQEGSFSGHGNENLTNDQKEIARLKKELRDSNEERDILKKAVRIFSKGDGKYSGS
jgi:transposase